ncbi:helix-turn-helix domain-containing protein [Actinokineospora guangxiensis]|uniref:Helix-turn-helix domain-containing protein n=1 Tax=Actinokineospora guangxiensis TaxID=1490288 RepID=A0ABW0END5_9PSEU
MLERGGIMPYPKKSTVSGSRLADELRVLRETAEMSCRQVGEQLGWNASKVSRMETGIQQIRLADLASLLVVYRVVGKERDRLLKLAERTDDLGFWEATSALSTESKTLIRLERDATAIVTFQPLLVPGLLQTGDYVRALMAAGQVPESDGDARVAARLARQSVLTKGDPPSLTFIVDEGALRRVLGSPRLMVRQLRHVLEAVERPQVTFRVLPLSLHGHPGLDGSFTMLDFERFKSVVYLDHKISGLFLEEPDQVAFYRREADRLLELALSPSESTDLVAAIAQEHDRE